MPTSEQLQVPSLARQQMIYDLERRSEGATRVSCNGFGDVIIENIEQS